VRLFRQLKSELGKLAHPVFALSLLGAALVASAAQIANGRTPYPAPSSADLTGSLWIAADQLSSTLGFVIGGFAAAIGTASEIRSGTLELVLLHEPRRARLIALKIAASFAALLFSLLAMTAVLRISAIVAASLGHPITQTASAGLGDASSHAIRFLVVAALIASIATLVAVASGSEIATIAVTTSAFAIPLLLLGAKTVSLLLPSRWIINWMYYDPFGAYVDYFASDSKLNAPSTTAGLVVATTACACGALAAWLMTRPIIAGGARH
jgi:ABC-type transport system involved in multi-copper enzyme maturation permease subunit